MKYFLPLLMISLNIGALLHPEVDAILNQTHIRFEWEQIPNVDYYALYTSEYLSSPYQVVLLQRNLQMRLQFRQL